MYTLRIWCMPFRVDCDNEWPFYLQTRRYFSIKFSFTLLPIPFAATWELVLISLFGDPFLFSSSISLLQNWNSCTKVVIWAFICAGLPHTNNSSNIVLVRRHERRDSHPLFSLIQISIDFFCVPAVSAPCFFLYVKLRNKKKERERTSAIETFLDIA